MKLLHQQKKKHLLAGCFFLLVAFCEFNLAPTGLSRRLLPVLILFTPRTFIVVLFRTCMGSTRFGADGLAIVHHALFGQRFNDFGNVYAVCVLVEYVSYNLGFFLNDLQFAVNAFVSVRNRATAKQPLFTVFLLPTANLLGKLCRAKDN